MRPKASVCLRPTLPIAKDQPGALRAVLQDHAASQARSRVPRDREAESAAVARGSFQAVKGIEHARTFRSGDAGAGVGDLDHGIVSLCSQPYRHLAPRGDIAQRIVKSIAEDEPERI